MSKKITEAVTALAEPIASALGLELWDVEFFKQESVYILCIYIDKPEGITLDDCERMSKAIDPVLDEYDPIEPSYCLRVSSPGVNRTLKRARHFKRFIGEKVMIRTYKSIGGLPKNITGILTGYDDGKITIMIDGGDDPIEFLFEDAASVKLNPDIKF